MKALKPLAFTCSSCCLWLFLFVSSLCTFCLCNHNSDPVLCIATERLALIQLKNDLIDDSKRLSSWLGKDCCSWSGVVCDNSTGHVHEIHLRGPDDGFHGHCHGSYDTNDELLEASKQMLGGTISPALINLTQLRYLNLSQNDLTGRIPNTFNKMGKLESLDLSENHLEGKFPKSLSGLTALNFLNVSYNNLGGKIPTGPQLQTFNESSFMGNELCGDPLPACITNDDDTEGSNNKQDDSNGIDWTLVIFTLFGLVVGFWSIIVPLLVSKQWRNAYYHFLGKMRIKLQDFLLLVFRCFRTRGSPPQTILFSSNDHLRRSNLSQYIIDQPKGSKQQESSNYEASSSTIHSIQ